jgi:heptosyltransferase-2
MKPTEERILVRGVNWLGDAVMSTPALQRLREARPAAHLTLLSHAKLADLFTGHPAVDSVLTFGDEDSVFAVARKIAAVNPSTALVLPNSPRSALEVFLARVPNRIGAARPWRNLFLTRVVPPHPGIRRMHKRSKREVVRLSNMDDEFPIRSGKGDYHSTTHQLHHYLHLAAALGAKAEPLAPHLEIKADGVAAIRQRFLSATSANHPTPLFGLNAGAEYGPAKRWPRERFVAAAIELQRRTQCQWWIFGGRADEPLASGIAAEIAAAGGGPADGVRCLAGKTSLRELCAALAACDLLLTNDTGPMHVAAAVGTPVIVPFGSTSPELTGPGLPGDKHHQLIQAGVPCSPCFRRECPIDFRCMHSIGIETVVEAALRVMRESPRNAAR